MQKRGLSSTDNDMKIQGIFFDLYGTLIVYGDMERAWDAWLHTLYSELEISRLSLSVSQFAAACESFFRREPPQVADDGLTVYERRLLRLSTELRFEPLKTDLTAAAEASLAAWQNYIYLDSEAIPLLSVLREQYKLVLLTNFDHPPHLRSYLPETGLDRFFDTVIISGEVGTRKPAARIFEIALERNGLLAEQVVFVGDSPADDVAGAKAAGIKPILIIRSGKVSTNDFTNQGEKDDATNVTFGYNAAGLKIISSLNELMAVLQEV